ncbi:MAG: hypothetical protein WBF90_37665 [Rivularia sp. (in: cyanobacteria)]
MKKTNVSQNLFAFIKQPQISDNLAHLPILRSPVKVENKSQNPK